MHEDDGCIHLYETLAAVVLEVEALDDEDVLRAVFDDTGQRYAVEWLRPNQEGWLSVANGEYRLVAAGTKDPAALVDLIRTVGRVYPPSAQAVVDALLQKLEGQPR